MADAETVEIRDQLAEIDWWHSIPITEEVMTDGWIPYSTHKRKDVFIPEDLSGKRVLDVGSWDAYYAIEAERRGADDVVALDINPDHAKGFEVLKDIIDSDIDYRIGDIMEYEFEDNFDIVICFGVLHHVDPSTEFLDKLSSLANETLCLETNTTPSLLNRSLQYDPSQPRRFEFWRRAIDGYADYDAKVPSVKWVKEEVEKRGFEIEDSDTHLGVLLQKKLPFDRYIPVPHRFLPTRYILRATR